MEINDIFFMSDPSPHGTVVNYICYFINGGSNEIIFPIFMHHQEITGSCSTFEFLSRVNLSGPSLYCIARILFK